MKPLITPLLLLFISFYCQSQDLTKSRTGSYFTAIYKLTNEEALRLLRSDEKELSNELFHSIVDYFPADSSYKKGLKPGHYLFVTSKEEILNAELKSENNLEMIVLNNHRDLQLSFLDNQGNEPNNLKVYIKGKRIPYDKTLKFYRLATTNKRGMVEVEHEGHKNYFEIGRQYNNTFWARSKRRILYGFPLRQVLAPARYIFQNTKSLIRYGHVSPPPIYYKVQRLFEEKKLDGFMVLSKPKYKPGDTVKFKTYITRKNGKPINNELEVELGGSGRKSFGYIKPYRPGCYSYEFVLSDSLKLSLDNQYNIYLWDKRLKHNYPSESFRYEQYELKQNDYFLRAASINLTKNKPKIILLKGTDINEMPLYDVNVELLLITKNVYNTYDKQMFIPDTLWHHSVKLEPIGETRVVLPDSIFQNAQIEMELKASFRNAENETQTRIIKLEYDVKTPEFESKLKNDSVWFLSTKSNVAYTLRMLDKRGKEMSVKTVSLPYHEKVNQHAANYELRDGKQYLTEISMEEDDLLEVSANRSKDSLHIQVENPRKLLFRYQLFRNNLIVENGFSDAYVEKRSTRPLDRYYLSIQYIWSGTAQEKNYDLLFSFKNIQLEVEHPATIYPGQSTEFKIQVNDALGNPLPNTDVTAMAITKKFRTSTEVDLKSYKKIKSRKAFNVFHLKENEIEPINERLNYDFWRNRLGLDSISYYHFLYPDGGKFSYSFLTEDSIAQVSPYVVKDGVVQTVHYIEFRYVLPASSYRNNPSPYFKNVLQYYKQAEQRQPYSFRVQPDSIDIILRLTDRVLTIKNVKVVKGQKRIMSYDIDHLPSDAFAIPIVTRLLPSEVSMLEPHFLWIKRDNDQRYSYFNQAENFYLPNYTANTSLVGPFYPDYMQFHFGEKVLPFYFQSHREYRFESNLIDRDYRNWPSYNYLYGGKVTPTFKDLVLTEKRIRKTIQQENQHRTFESPHNSTYYSPYATPKGKGRLKINSRVNPKLIARAVFFLNLNNPDEYFIYPGEHRVFENLQPGPFQVVIVYNDGNYHKPKPFYIKQNGKTYYDLLGDSLRKEDKFSKDILDKLSKWTLQSVYEAHVRNNEMQEVREEFYRQSTLEADLQGGRWISGFVKAKDDGVGLPGVNVVVKGTTLGTITDADGHYQLYVPYNGVLVFSFIGMKTLERKSYNNIDVNLESDIAALEEVVVTAQGIERSQKSLGYAQTTVSSTLLSNKLQMDIGHALQGRSPGLQILNASGLPGASSKIVIRGISTLNPNAQPLYVLDGRVIDSNELIDPSRISRIEVLKGDSATAIYGSKGANGVILISTKPNITRDELLKTRIPEISIPEVSEGSTLRKNFRDNAFWKPRLVTDEQGKVSFKTTFPDDVTSWDVNIIAIATEKRTAQKQSTVRAFKPLLAQLALPQFLIEGDSSMAIGKITNYTPSNVSLTRSTTINKNVSKENFELVSSKIDSIMVIASEDSLVVQYEVAHQGYRDGELRKVPLYKRGTLESKGVFVAMPEDTTFYLNLSNPLGKIILHGEADMLNVLWDEIQRLKVYPYECNEQLASKLKAILAEKAIQEYKNEDFKNDEQVKKAIRKLTERQNRDGGWGWWQDGSSRLWISSHVVSALKWAKSSGYKVSYDEVGLRSFIRNVDVNVQSQDGLKSLIAISEQGEKIMAQSVVDTLLKHRKLYSLYDSLLAQRLLQINGIKPDWNWISSKRNETLKGNWYWGHSSYSLWNNDIDNTLLVYQMMELENPSDKNLNRIQNYFIERRKLGWRNTYESARIIEIIMPALIRQPYTGKPVLSITGSINETISRFPYHKEVNGLTDLKISKSGNGSAFFTAYYQEWNAIPEKVEKDFLVTTNWKDALSTLKAGKEIALEVTVSVEKDADYVMINVPIPAGCSYAAKPQSRMQGEVHREYDVHETRIYCERMKKGVYHYSISLIPRYKGTYTLNPAKAEWMYFPTIYGRNEIKKTRIK